MVKLPSRQPAATFFLVIVLLGAEAVQAQSPAAEQLYAAAQGALAARRFDEAREDYSKLSKLHPAIAEVHATLGALDFQLKRYPEALQELKEAHRLKPALPRLDGLIAMSLSELGRFEEALPDLQRVFGDTDDQEIKRMSGLQLERTYIGLDRQLDAVAVALTLQKLFPRDPEVLYHNERIFGSFAYLTVQKLVEVAPDSVWRHQAQAEAQEAAGDHAGSIAQYRVILALDSNRGGVHYRIGRALRSEAHDTHDASALAEAMQEFKAELKNSPDNASALYEIGELHRVAGEYEPARDAFAAALKSYPDFPEANLGLGTVLANLHQPAAALPYLRRAIANDPRDEANWYRLSQVERSLGHADEQKKALAEFQRLHKVEGASPAASPRDVTRQEVGQEAGQEMRQEVNQAIPH